MDKNKVCPFRKAHGESPVNLTENYLVPSWMDDFGPCLEDKCQMWRVTRNGTQTDYGYVEGSAVGYCGLAGKP